MAGSIIRDINARVWNDWDILRGQAQMSGLYNQADFESLNVVQQQAYLGYLANNGKALKDRLPSIYNAANAEERFMLISGAANAEEINLNNSEARTQFTDEFNKYLKQESPSYVNWLVDTRFNGDYESFLKSDIDIENELGTAPEDMYNEYTQNKDTLGELKGKAEKFKSDYVNKNITDYQNLISSIEYNVTERNRQKAYEAASGAEKFWHTVGSIVFSALTEPLNMFEGLIDTGALFIGSIGGLFDSNFEAQVKDFISRDITQWADPNQMSLDTIVNEIFPYSNATSPYETNSWAWGKIANSIVTNLERMSLNFIPGAGHILYYSTMPGSTAEEYLSDQPNASIWEAGLYAAGATLIEWSTENISSDAFFGDRSVIKIWENFGARHPVTRVIHDFIGEGLEEVISDLGKGLWYGLLTGDISKISADDLLQSFVVGGLLGFIGAVGSEVTMYRVSKNVETQIKSKKNGKTLQLTKHQAAALQQYIDRVDDLKGINADRQSRADKKNKAYERKNKDKTKTATEIQLNPRQQLIYDTLNDAIWTDIHNGVVIDYRTQEEFKNDAINKLKELKPKLFEETTEQPESLASLEDEQMAELLSKADVEDVNANIDTASKDLKNIFGIYLNTVAQQYGTKVTARGVELYEAEITETAEKVVEFLNAEIDTAADGKYSSEVSKAFGGAQVAITKHDASIDTAIKAAVPDKLRGNVYTFVSTKMNMPNVFVLNGNIYLNQAMINKVGVDNAVKLAVSQHMAYNIANNLTPTQSQLVDRVIEGNGISIEQVSADIQRQQVVYIMLFAEDNTLITQLNILSAKDIKAMQKYYKDRRDATPNIITRNIIAQGQKVIDNAVIDSVAPENIEQVADRISDNLSQDEAVQRANSRLNSNVGGAVSFVADSNITTADVVTAYKVLKMRYNFDYDASGKTILELAQAMTDLNNYSDKGKAISEVLKQYSKTNINTRGRFKVSKHTTNKALFNYFFADNFNFQISADNVIIHNSTVDKIFDLDRVKQLTEKNVNMNISEDLNSEYILSDFLTEEGIAAMGPDFGDFAIYFVNEDIGAYGITETFTRPIDGKKGFIVISTSVVDSSKHKGLSGFQNTLLHEMRHAIGSMTGITQSLSRDMITSRNAEGQYIGILDQICNEAKDNAAKNKLAEDIAVYLGKTMYPKKSFEDRVAMAQVFINDPSKRIVLANSMYNYVFANEQLADGSPGAYIESNNLGVSSIAYADVRSASNVKRRNAAIITTQSEDAFLKRFNGRIANIASVDRSAFETRISQLRNNAISRNDIIQDTIDGRPQLINSGSNETEISIADIKSIFGDEKVSDADLVNKDFWISKCSDSRLKEVLNNMSLSYFNTIVKAYTNYQYNTAAKTFEHRTYTRAEANDLVNEDFAPNADYSAALLSEYAPRNLQDPKLVYNQHNVKVKGAIIYDSNSRTAVVKLDDVRINNETLKTLKKVAKTVGRGNMTFIVGNRVFLDFSDAQRYRNTNDIKAENIKTTTTAENQLASFETMFDHLTSGMVSRNTFDYKYFGDGSTDTIFVTNDGRIYTGKFDGHLTDKCLDICDKNGLGRDTVGRYGVEPDSGNPITNEEGLTNDISRLLDAKRVLRLHKTGNSWQAYGIPNIIQDRFLSNINLSSNAQTFIDTEPAVKLVIDNKTGKVKIVDINSKESEVPWKNNRYYYGICKLISDYNISSFDQLRSLGFTDDFIQHLAQYQGRKTYGKTGSKKINVEYNGITEQYIAEYLNDNSNTDMSRNILIQTFWPNNPHIRSIKDIKSYLNAMQAYTAILTYHNDTTIYASVKDLQMKYNGFNPNPDVLKLQNNIAEIVASGSANIYTRVLNLDEYSKKYPNRLDLSLQGFSILFDSVSAFSRYTTETAGNSLEVKTDKGEFDITEKTDKYSTTQEEFDNQEAEANAVSAIRNKLIKVNNLLTVEEQYDALENILDEVDRMDLSEDAESLYKEIILDNLSKLDEGKLISIELADTGEANAYVSSINEQLDAIDKLEGKEQVKARNKAESEFVDLINNAIRYKVRYGYEGYMKLREAYNKHGYSKLRNTQYLYYSERKTVLKQAERIRKAHPEKYEKAQRTVQAFDKVYQDLSNISTDVPGRTARIAAVQEAFHLWHLGDKANAQNVQDTINDAREFTTNAAQQGKYKFTPDQQDILDQLEEFKKDKDMESYRIYLNNAITDDEVQSAENWALAERLQTLKDKLDDIDEISGAPELKADKFTKGLSKEATAKAEKRAKKADEREIRQSMTRGGSWVENPVAPLRYGRLQLGAPKGFRPSYKTYTIDEEFEMAAKRDKQYEASYLRMAQLQMKRYETLYEKLANSPAVSEQEIKEFMQDIYRKLMSSDKDAYNFWVYRDLWRAEARKAFKVSHPKEADICKDANRNKANRKYSDTEVKAAQEFRQKFIETYVGGRLLTEIQTVENDEIRKELKRLGKLDSEIESFMAMREANSAKADSLKAEIKRLENELDRTKNKIKTTEDFISDLEQQISNIDKLDKDAAKLQARMSSSLDRAKSELSTEQARLEPLEDEIKESTKQRSTLLSEIESSARKLGVDRFIDKLKSKENSERIRSIAASRGSEVVDRGFNDLYMKSGKLSELQHRMLNGLQWALLEFEYMPKTKAALNMFKADIDTVLFDRKINRTIPGDPKRRLLSIKIQKDAEGNIAIPDADRIKILDSFKEGKYVDNSIDRINSRLNANDKYSIAEFAKFVASELAKIYTPSVPDAGKIANEKVKAAAEAEQGRKAYEQATFKSEGGRQFTVESVKNLQDEKRRAKEFVHLEAEARNRAAQERREAEELQDLLLNENNQVEESDEFLNDWMQHARESAELQTGKNLKGQSKIYNAPVLSDDKIYGKDNQTIEEFDNDDTDDIDEISGAPQLAPINDIAIDWDIMDVLRDRSKANLRSEEERHFEPREERATREVVGSSKLSAATNKMLNYRYAVERTNKADEVVPKVDTNEFIKYNNFEMRSLLESEENSKAFIEWLESGPAFERDLQGQSQQATALILANNIHATATLSEDLRNRALKLVQSIRSSNGRLNALGRNIGLTRTAELSGAALRAFELTEAEKKLLDQYAAEESAAISKGDYNKANEIFMKTLDIYKAHQSELDTSINFFAKDLTEAQRVTRAKHFIDRMNSFRYWAMLGNPATFMFRNALGNVALRGANAVSDSVASVMSKFTESRKSKIKTKAVTAIEQFAKANNVDIGEINTVKDAEAALKNIRDKNITIAPEVEEAFNDYARADAQYKLTKSSSKEADAAVQAALIDNGKLKAISEGWLSRYDTGYEAAKRKRLKADATEAEIEAYDQEVLRNQLMADKPFGERGLAGPMNWYYKFMYSQMEGNDQKNVQRHVINLMGRLVASNCTDAEIEALRTGQKGQLSDAEFKEVQQKFDDMLQYSVDDALKTYLKSPSKVHGAIMKALEGHPIAQAAISVLVPFPRMMLNVARTALEYSPIGYIMAGHTWFTDKTAFRDIKFNKQMGKATVGTIAIGVGVLFAALGFIKIDKDDEYAGPQLNLFNTFTISLEDLSPSTIPLIVGASFVSGLSEGFWNGVLDGGNALLDYTLIGELIGLFRGKTTPVDFGANIINTLTSQFIPAMLRTIARTTDPYQKNISGNIFQRWYKKTFASIPGLSKLIKNKVDPYTGQYMTYYADNNNPLLASLLTIANAVLPMKLGYTVDSEVENESELVNAATTGPAQKFTIDGVEYEIDEKTYYKYLQLRAKLYNQYASSVIHTDYYKRMSIDQKKTMLKNLQLQATNNAREQLNITK